MAALVPPPPLSAVETAKLKLLSGPSPGQEIQAKSLWQQHPALVLVLRRPGCILCRAEAKRIWEEDRPKLEGAGVRLACTVHEALPAEISAFSPAFWGGDLYLDTDKAFYKALNEGKGSVRRGSLLSFLNPWSRVWQHAKEAKKTISDSNFKGDGLTMGGSMVIRSGQKGVEYAYAEHIFGDHATSEALLEAAKAAKAHSA